MSAPGEIVNDSRPDAILARDRSLDARFIRLETPAGLHAVVNHWDADPRDENVAVLFDTAPASKIWVDADLWLPVPANRVE